MNIESDHEPSIRAYSRRSAVVAMLGVGTGIARSISVPPPPRLYEVLMGKLVRGEAADVAKSFGYYTEQPAREEAKVARVLNVLIAELGPLSAVAPMAAVPKVRVQSFRIKPTGTDMELLIEQKWIGTRSPRFGSVFFGWVVPPNADSSIWWLDVAVATTTGQSVRRAKGLFAKLASAGDDESANPPHDPARVGGLSHAAPL